MLPSAVDSEDQVGGTRIVGIFLVRDEDLFVEQAVRNVSAFCDELLLVDNGSRDETPRILARLAEALPIPAAVHRVRHPSRSHELIAPLAGDDVWIFGVDGDELYDPSGLAALKPRLVGGEFDDAFQIRGNVLHCTELDVAGRRARGFLSPPSASMTKLYNFRIIESWSGHHAQRLHGGNGLRFKAPNEFSRRLLNETYGWNDSPFRCLHVCFLRRSSRERARAPEAGRESPGERYAVPRRWPVRLFRHLRSAAGIVPVSNHKHTLYRLGPLVTVSALPFL
jgi:glycosyltransferase involved in cell wall biosynthesis